MYCPIVEERLVAPYGYFYPLKPYSWYTWYPIRTRTHLIYSQYYVARMVQKRAYKEYQSALRRFNYQLSALKTHLNMSSHLSSYSARHTWATMAYYCEIHPGIISEAMGHSSINVTETYLKPFNDKKIDEANEKVISFVKAMESRHRFFIFIDKAA